MAERPILFCGSMVRAILDGRKTVTRRLPMPKRWVPGDRLWVRETHTIVGVPGVEDYFPPWYDPDKIVPHAAARNDVWETRWALFRADWEGEAPGRWFPSIHMPRWASRITLDITSVRVERLDDVTEAEAQLEGFDSLADFRALWASLYRDKGDNPWLWRVEFRRVK